LAYDQLLAITHTASTYAQGTYKGTVVSIYKWNSATSEYDWQQDIDPSATYINFAQFQADANRIWGGGDVPTEIGYVSRGSGGTYGSEFSDYFWGSTFGGRIFNITITDDLEWIVGHYYSDSGHAPKVYRLVNGTYTAQTSTGLTSKRYYCHAAISPDGNYVVVTASHSSSYDQSPYIWVYSNDDDGTFTEMTINLDGNSFQNSYGIAIQWSPDSKIFTAWRYAFTYDDVEEEWQICSPSPYLYKGSTSQAAFSPDGNWFVSTLGANAYFELYSVATDSLTWEKSVEAAANVKSLCWSADGAHLIVGTTNSSTPVVMFEQSGDTFTKNTDSDWSAVDDDVCYISSAQYEIVYGFSAGIGFSDSQQRISSYNRHTEDGIGFGDSNSRIKTKYRHCAPDGLGFSDTVNSRQVSCNRHFTAGIGVSDAVHVFNFSEWLRLYNGLYSLRYEMTLTGDADGTTDIVIPIESFQARHRSGDPSYLSVTIPNIDDYSASVNARLNGQLKIEMIAYVNNIESVREEIIRVDFESIRTDRGATNQSITLSGHRTETYSAKTTELRNVTLRVLQANGKLRFRSSEPDFYLRPGDTATYDTDSITVGLITLNINTLTQNMEVTED